MRDRVFLLMLGLVVAVPSTAHAAERLSFATDADSLAGRKAFAELKCTRCHRVLGDPALPQPVSGAAPVLGGLNAEHTTEELAQAIVSPSHSLAPGFESKEGSGSPMQDMSRVMTVRQLVDIVAYLKESENADSPWPKDGP